MCPVHFCRKFRRVRVMTRQILTQTSKSGNTLNGVTVDTFHTGLQWKKRHDKYLRHCYLISR